MQKMTSCQFGRWKQVFLRKSRKTKICRNLPKVFNVSNMAFRHFRRLVLPGTLISFGSFVTFGFSTLQAKAEQGKSGRVARIAIIGSGIAGSSAAHFVRQILGPDAQIEVFERSDKVGGRLATIQVAGHVYEAGGSIIHPENMYMKSFVKDLGKEELVNYHYYYYYHHYYYYYHHYY